MFRKLFFAIALIGLLPAWQLSASAQTQTADKTHKDVAMATPADLVKNMIGAVCPGEVVYQYFYEDATHSKVEGDVWKTALTMETFFYGSTYFVAVVEKATKEAKKDRRFSENIKISDGVKDDKIRIPYGRTKEGEFYEASGGSGAPFTLSVKYKGVRHGQDYEANISFVCPAKPAKTAMQ